MKLMELADFVIVIVIATAVSLLLLVGAKAGFLPKCLESDGMLFVVSLMVSVVVGLVVFDRVN